MSHLNRITSFVVTGLLIASCGGGGSKGSTPTVEIISTLSNRVSTLSVALTQMVQTSRAMDARSTATNGAYETQIAAGYEDLTHLNATKVIILRTLTPQPSPTPTATPSP